MLSVYKGAFFSSRQTVVITNTALWWRFGPVVVIAQSHLGLCTLTNEAILAQSIPLNLHVCFSLLVSYKKLVGASTRRPFGIKSTQVDMKARRKSCILPTLYHVSCSPSDPPSMHLEWHLRCYKAPIFSSCPQQTWPTPYPGHIRHPKRMECIYHIVCSLYQPTSLWFELVLSLYIKHKRI